MKNSGNFMKNSGRFSETVSAFPVNLFTGVNYLFRSANMSGWIPGREADAV
jgi:hypothetical protein